MEGSWVGEGCFERATDGSSTGTGASLGATVFDGGAWLPVHATSVARARTTSGRRSFMRLRTGRSRTPASAVGARPGRHGTMSVDRFRPVDYGELEASSWRLVAWGGTVRTQRPKSVATLPLVPPRGNRISSEGAVRGTRRRRRVPGCGAEHGLEVGRRQGRASGSPGHPQPMAGAARAARRALRPRRS